MPNSQLPAIAGIAGVLEVQPRVWGYYFVPAMSGNFTVIGVDTGAESVRRDLALVEIGVLKAVGWRTGDVLVARLWENTLIAVYGALPGILAAYGYVFFARAPGLAEVLLGWSSIYPVLRLTPAIGPGQLLVIAFAWQLDFEVTASCVRSGWMPRW